MVSNTCFESEENDTNDYLVCSGWRTPRYTADTSSCGQGGMLECYGDRWPNAVEYTIFESRP